LPAPGSNAAQTINFPTLSNTAVGRSQKLLATASSGMQVTYLSLTPDICYLLYPATGAHIQSVSKLPENGPWTCTIRATQAGDDRYVPANSVERTFNYEKASMVLVVENGTALTGAGPHAIITRVRFADSSFMSGLLSLGHTLTVQNLTPTICRVDSHGLWDRTNGIVNRTYLAGLLSGTCSLRFDFAGTADRAATSLTWNARISR
jgi:hypothetical protein